MTVNELTGFHLEITNMCTLKCPGCPRTRFINEWPDHWTNVNLDLQDLLKFLDVDLTGKSLQLCGNYGDPIYHPEFHQFVAELKLKGAHLTINTNGSYKDASWWDTTCRYLDSNDEVVFGIDGMPDTFTQYRINADWNSIQIGIQTVGQSDAKARWQFLPFKFNEQEIDQAQKLAESLGCEFFVYPSDRFDEQTVDLIPVKQELVRDRFDAQQKFKQGKKITKLKPQCDNGRMHYISAQGYYAPCCFVQDHRFFYKTQFGKNKSQYDIKDTTFSQLIKEKPVTDFFQSLADHSVCQFNCPSR